MGKGGDASAVSHRGPMKLVGDKSEKYTWSEVKKHVSTPTETNGYVVFSALFSSALNLLYHSPNSHLINRSHRRMHGSSTKTGYIMSQTGMSIPEAE